MVLGFILAGAFYYYQLHYGTGDLDPDFRKALISAIPLAVISSAIAIPSAINLSKKNKEFVTYESSLSDILGVLFFDFVFRNVTIDFNSFWIFLLQIIIIAIISFIATIGLSFLLARINHQIKFIPIIILVILIYTLSKIYHLPALIFIMLFGLFIGNLDEIKNVKIIQTLKPEKLDAEVRKFHEILREGTFLIRVMFFLLFGFLIKTEELLNQKTFYWVLGIVALIFIIRFIQLKTSKLPAMPLMFVAPRGLITILLFLYIPAEDSIELVNKSLVIQVILLSVIIMMIGLMFDKQKDEHFFTMIIEKMAMEPSDAEISLSKKEEVLKANSEGKIKEDKDKSKKAELLENANEAENLEKTKISSEISAEINENDQEKNENTESAGDILDSEDDSKK